MDKYQSAAGSEGEKSQISESYENVKFAQTGRVYLQYLAADLNLFT